MAEMKPRHNSAAISGQHREIEVRFLDKEGNVTYRTTVVRTIHGQSVVLKKKRHRVHESHGNLIIMVDDPLCYPDTPRPSRR